MPLNEHVPAVLALHRTRRGHSMSSALYPKVFTSVPSERSAHPIAGKSSLVPALAPRCPICSGPMVLSHKFYAEPDGPLMRHFHCKCCKVGLTQADEEYNDEDVR